MTETFSKLMSNTKSQIQEARGTIGKIKAPKKLYPGKLYSKYTKSKVKKKILNKSRGKKHLTQRRANIRIMSDFSEIMEPRRQ